MADETTTEALVAAPDAGPVDPVASATATAVAAVQALAQAEHVAAAPAEPPADFADQVRAAIVSGLANSAISQSEAAWAALQVRLPAIVATIVAIV